MPFILVNTDPERDHKLKNLKIETFIMDAGYKTPAIAKKGLRINQSPKMNLFILNRATRIRTLK